MIESILLALLGWSLFLGIVSLMLLPVAVIGFGIEWLLSHRKKRIYNEKSND
jgi:hypothetical protein